MYTRFLVALTLLVAFTACKNDPDAATGLKMANPNNLSGQWIAMDFCARASQYGSVLQAEANAHRPYALAITFNSAQPDSALCYDSSKSWKLPIKINQDTVELQQAANGKSVFLVFDSHGDKNITMFDNASGAGPQMDKFIKSNANAKDGYTAFLTALNHNLFSGTFTPLTKGPGEKVMFTPGGFLQGWKEFDRYQVCTGGDCFVMGNEMDVIRLSHSKQEDSTKIFGFKYSSQNDTLTLVNLVDATPNEKGGYSEKGVAFKFLRTESRQH